MGLALFDLLASSGVNYETLKAADEQELIRLEKRIKAAQKLNTNYSQELVVQAIETIRNRKNALLFILSEPTIQALHLGEYEYLFSTKIDLPLGKELGDLRAMFLTLLESDLRELMMSLMRENEWVAVHSWLKLKPVLSSDLFHALQRKLVDLLSVLFYSIREQNWDVEQQIQFRFIDNRTFYHVMNQLDCAELEALIYQFFNDSRGYRSKGINVKWYTQFLDKLSIYRPYDDHFHRSKQAVSGFSRTTGKSNDTSSPFKTVGIAIFILFSLVRLVRSCDNLNSDSRYTNGGSIEQIAREQQRAEKQRLKNFMNFEILQVGLGSIWTFGSCDSVKSNKQLRIAEPQLLNLDATTGQIIHGDLVLKGPSKTRSPVVFVNKTKQDIVAYLIVSAEVPELVPGLVPNDPNSMMGLSQGAVVIKAGDSFQIHTRIIKFFIHSGKHLYRYQYYSRGRKQPYSWAFCPLSKLDAELVRHTFDFYKETKESGGRIELSKTKSSYKIKWTGNQNTLYDRNVKTYLSKNSFHVIDLKKEGKENKQSRNR